MWMDIVQTVEPERDNRSDEEDTVYDRSGEYNENKGPFEPETSEARGMLEEDETRCGIGNWRPAILQQFVNKNVFTCVFVLTGIIQGASWAYFTSTISTLEKRFKMSSETTGALLAGNEVSQLIISIILTYFGIRKNRMKFITIGVVLMAFSSFLLASPHLMFGSGKYALSFTKPQEDFVFHGAMNDNLGFKINNENDNNPQNIIATSTPNITENPPGGDLSTGIDPGLIENEDNTYTTLTEDESSQLVTIYSSMAPTNLTSTTASTLDNYITFQYSYENDQIMSHMDQLCMRDVEFIANSTQRECSLRDSGSSFPISILFIGQMIAGVGTMLFISAGGPYMEDIVMPNELPIVFGITLALRLMGPFLGYAFAHSFLQSFISNVAQPNITHEDPRWMGRWWLGWLLLSIFMTIVASLIALFPRQMAREMLKKRSMTTDTGPAMLILPGCALYLGSAETKVANVLPIFSNLSRTAMVFFQNQISVLITLSALFNIFVGVGYWSFVPKYLEVMFHETSSGAAILSGSISSVFQGSGLLISGILMSKLTPSAERVSFWSILITGIRVLLLIILTQFRCDHGDVTFGHIPMTINPTSVSVLTTNEITVNPTMTMTHSLSNCSIDCDCPMTPMIPLCDEDTGRLFYSPCHAGCEQILDNGTVFADCSCIGPNSTLTKGFCEGNNGCYPGFITFLIFTAIAEFLGSTGVVGKMLIFYRSVALEGRSLVIGLTLLVISIFAIIPSPIIFGSILDSSCHIWENTCANHVGNCWLYNNKSLRYSFNLAAAGFLLLGGCFDLLLWRKIQLKDVRLYDGDIDPKPSSSRETQDQDL